MIALAQGRHAQAIESLSRAAELEPDWADVHNSLGSALIQAGRVPEAVAALERAIELRPEVPPAWYNLCGALFQLGHPEKATNCLLRLETLSPHLAAQVRSVFISPGVPTTGE